MAAFCIILHSCSIVQKRMEVFQINILPVCTICCNNLFSLIKCLCCRIRCGVKSVIIIMIVSALLFDLDFTFKCHWLYRTAAASFLIFCIISQFSKGGNCTKPLWSLAYWSIAPFFVNICPVDTSTSMRLWFSLIDYCPEWNGFPNACRTTTPF